MIIDGRITSPADADDLRVEHIAAQLEEHYQEDIWIEWLFEQAMEVGTSPAIVSPKPALARRRRRQSRIRSPEDQSWVGSEVCGGAVGSSTHEPTTYDYLEIDMAKPPFERRSHPQHLPAAPAPSSTSASEGMERTRALARRYLPDLVRLHAGIALAPDSEAALHTRMLAAKEIRELAGGIPQMAPPARQPHYEDGGGGEHS
jgi:hypothetical protein